MNFILYFILRKFFVRLAYSDEKLTLTKGLFLKRIHVIPFSSVVRITCKQSLLQRLFRAKQIELFTRNGSFKFFLRRDEPVPAFHEPPAHFIKPRFREVVFGAFIDVRALGAIALFAAVMRRIGTIFGGRYLDGILALLDNAAVNVERAFAAMRVYVPRVAAVLAVFALSAWVFSFLRRLDALARFRVGRSGGQSEASVVVTSGFFTLYETMLVPNSSAAVVCDSPVSLLFKHAPVYLRGAMIYPCADRAACFKLARILCGERADRRMKRRMTRPPKKALFGYCAAPLWQSAGFAAALALVYAAGLPYSVMLLKTALYCGLIISLYTAAVYLYYMKYSGIAADGGVCLIAARRFMRLYTALLPASSVTARTVSQSVFQRCSGLCDFKISTDEPQSFKARLIPLTNFDGYDFAKTETVFMPRSRS